MLLKNKTAVVTGCNRGIGLSVLETFSKNGANIVACVRKEDKYFKDLTNQLMKKYKNKIDIVCFDLESEKDIIKAFNLIKSIVGHINIIVNNAGVNHISLFQMTPLKIFKSIFDVNFFSVVSFTQKLLKLITKNNNSKIINISSNAVNLADPGRSAYASSKAALVTFTKVLSKELANYKINVNCIAPGLVNTDMMKETPKKAIDEALSLTPLKKPAEPVDVANLALFLASDKSNHITGETIFVTGGM